MASTGNEATFSMGDDAPLAALSSQPHTLYDYFKQRFAQVTNPAIDPLREGAVMSLNMFLGPRTDPTAANGPDDFPNDKRIKIESPLLNEAEMEVIANEPGMTVTSVSTLYPLVTALTAGGLKSQIEVVCNQVVEAVRAGASVIDLTDKVAGAFDSAHTYIPPLVAVSAVHHRLIAEGLRTNCSIVATTGQAWSTHHFALLVGYGASAVVPYGAYDAVVNWHSQKRNQNAMGKGDLPNISAGKAIENYRKAVDKGLLKILSKMGISLLTSYHGAQIFEALGLADEVVLETFKGTPCRISGLTYDDIAAETAQFSRKVFGDDKFAGMIEAVEGPPEVEGLPKEEGETSKKLFNYGFLNYFKTGEYHHNNQV
jgi:glutamate synthase (ferredoxin)